VYKDYRDLMAIPPTSLKSDANQLRPNPSPLTRGQIRHRAKRNSVEVRICRLNRDWGEQDVAHDLVI